MDKITHQVKGVVPMDKITHQVRAERWAKIMNE